MNSIFMVMFVRRNKNRSGSISVQITQKVNRKNRVIKTVGIANTQQEVDILTDEALKEIKRLQGQSSLFPEE